MGRELRKLWGGVGSWLAIFGYSICILTTDAVLGQDKSPVDVVRPYLDETTIGVAWCDVEKLNVTAVAGLARAFNVPVTETAHDYAKSIVTSLRSQGVVKVYSVIDVDAIMESRPPLFILQAKPDANLSLVQAMVAPLITPADLSVIKDGKFLLVGSKKVLETKQEHPAARLDRLEKQMNAANQANAICIAPSAEMSEALRMTMNLGVGAVEEQPFELRFILLFAPMEGLRVDTSVLHGGARGVVDFATTDKAENFKSSMKTLLSWDQSLDVEPILPEVVDASAVWQLERFMGFCKRISSRFAGDAEQVQASTNLKQLALALHNYESTYRSFPPQAVASSEGKRLLSWRVLLLPFLGREDLYSKFHLDEAWDSPHNIALVKEMPQFFARPGTDPTLGKTPYVAPLARESFFGRPGAPAHFRDVRDGTSNTIWLIDAPAEFEVTWTKPEDWEVKGLESIELIRRTKPQWLVSFVDGSVRALPKTVSSDTIFKMFTIAGGEVISID